MWSIITLTCLIPAVFLGHYLHDRIMESRDRRQASLEKMHRQGSHSLTQEEFNALGMDDPLTSHEYGTTTTKREMGRAIKRWIKERDKTEGRT